MPHTHTHTTLCWANDDNNNNNYYFYYCQRRRWQGSDGSEKGDSSLRTWLFYIATTHHRRSTLKWVLFAFKLPHSHNENLFTIIYSRRWSAEQREPPRHCLSSLTDTHTHMHPADPTTNRIRERKGRNKKEEIIRIFFYFLFCRCQQNVTTINLMENRDCFALFYLLCAVSHLFAAAAAAASHQDVVAGWRVLAITYFVRDHWIWCEMFAEIFTTISIETEFSLSRSPSRTLICWLLCFSRCDASGACVHVFVYEWHNVRRQWYPVALHRIHVARCVIIPAQTATTHK